MSEIPLTPIEREGIHRLESALMIATLFSEEAIADLKNPEERLTWVDSLAVAAAALAREKAKMSVSQIADELGRSEASIRAHLAGKTKAGKLVKETYERFIREGVKIKLPELFLTMQETLTDKRSEELETLKKRVEELEARASKLSSVLERQKAAREKTISLLDELDKIIKELRATISGM